MNNKKHYRRKPVVIVAEQWHAGQDPETYPPCVKYDEAQGRYYVLNIHGRGKYLDDGDWIMPEEDGIHFYSMKAETFAELYEEVV